MVTTHVYAGLLHPGSVLCSGLIIDFFQMPVRAGNCLPVLHLDVSQTDGSKG